MIESVKTMQNRQTRGNRFASAFSRKLTLIAARVAVGVATAAVGCSSSSCICLKPFFIGRLPSLSCAGVDRTSLVMLSSKVSSSSTTGAVRCMQGRRCTHACMHASTTCRFRLQM